MRFIGSKEDKDLYLNLIKEHLPSNIEDLDYVEPFGGSFGLAKTLDVKPKRLIYNDLILYDVDICIADEIHHLDYNEILNMYDNENTIFYLDPPYYGKEHIYGMERKFNIFHEELRNNVKNRKGTILISYEKCSFISKLYNGETIYLYNGKNHYKEKEMLIKI